MVEAAKDWQFWLELLALFLAPHMVITCAVVVVLFKFRKGFKDVVLAFFQIFGDGKKGMKLTVGSDLFTLETVAREADSSASQTTGVVQMEGVGKEANTSVVATITNGQSPVVNPKALALMQIDQHPILLDETEAQLRRILLDAQLDISSETAKVLIRNLAATSIDRAFEKDYSMIRGSEIQILEKMNSLVPGSMPVPMIDKHTEDTRAKFPNFYTKSLSASEYLSWLISSTLVLRTDTGFGITVRGAGFLRWMIVNNKVLDKAL